MNTRAADTKSALGNDHPGTNEPVKIAIPRDRPLSKFHFPALDGLRGLAILAVMLNHYGSFVFTGGSIWQHSLAVVARRGYLGVDLFFVLSGFLITGILVDAKGSADYLKRFYWRRSLRIFPLYFFYLTMAFLVIRPLFPSHFVNLNPLWYITYLANWHMGGEMMNPFLAHLWSLAVEEQFYLVWPFVVMLVPNSRLAWFCGVVAVVALLLRLSLFGHVAEIYLYILTPSRMDALAAGAFIATAIRNEQMARAVNRVKWPVAVFCILCWLLTINNQLENTLSYSPAAVFFAIIVFWAASSSPTLLTASPLRFLGKYSYGLYIYHVLPRNALLWQSQHLLPGSLYKIVFPLATFAVTLALAMLSWRFLESPFLRLKDRYFRAA